MINFNRMRRLLLAGDSAVLTAAQIYANYVTSLAPLFWLKLNETSGTTAANSGSLGATQNGTWTPGVGGVGQTGQLGANDAYLFDALDSKIAVTRSASMDGITKQTWCFLQRPTAVGENSSGTLFQYANNASARAINNVNRAINMILAATGNATSLTNINFIPAYNSAWYWLFMTYEDDGDRLIHIYKGLGGAVTEATYATHTAATGTLTANSGSSLNIGNRLANDSTYDGLMDEVVFFNRILSGAEMLQLVTLAGLT